MKLFVFVFSDIKYYDRQNAVVMAETREQANALLIEAIAAVKQVSWEELPDDLSWVWGAGCECYSGVHVDDVIEVREVDGPVAFTYGVDG